MRDELNVNALREFDLAVRVSDLEQGRWSAFSIVELEWLTSAVQPETDAADTRSETLPQQANAELERRARVPAGADPGDR